MVGKIEVQQIKGDKEYIKLYVSTTEFLKFETSVISSKKIYPIYPLSEIFPEKSSFNFQQKKSETLVVISVRKILKTNL